MTVVVLEDAAEDIESGKQFYESQAPGIGEYFVESILSDLSLGLVLGDSSSTFWFPSDVIETLSFRDLL
jgi:hypothetical protein